MDGFSDLYRAFCAHAAQRLPPRLDITWDVDNIMALNHGARLGAFACGCVDRAFPQRRCLTRANSRARSTQKT